MKKMFLPLTILSATLFLAAEGADAPKNDAPSASAAPAPLTAAETALIKRYDRNGDGRLDESELAAAHEKMLQDNRGDNPGSPAGKFRAALVRRFDRDGDGKLDATEEAEAKRVILARFDTNHDGRLDEEERAAMREAFRARAKALKAK